MLDRNQLKYLRDLLGHNVEYCGSVLKDGTIANWAAGPPIDSKAKSRGSCPFNGENTFHTHPIRSFAVPSTRDLVMLINRPYRKRHMLITKWGVYDLVNNTPATAYNGNRKLPSRITAFIEERFQVVVDELIINTRVPRTQRGANGNKSGNLTDRKRQLIDVFCQKVQHASGGYLNIHFKDWNTLGM